jgi:DNA-binding response OmpR family regulator
LLLVDDEEIVRFTLREFLLFLGHKIDEAEEGLSGIQMLARKHYDAAFVDMRMPKLDGLGFLQQCREKWPELPVFLVSGHATETTGKEVLEAGARGFLHKPFGFDEIRQLLAAIE